MSKTFVVGDIHGAYKALIQCLERSNFDYNNDTLIQLGDVADGWDEVYECVEELLKIKNLIRIRGNHDEWFNQFILHNKHSIDWQQGGLGTLQSYCLQLDKLYYNKNSGGYITSLLNTDIPTNHKDFFVKQINYWVDDKNRCFVHGGFNRHYKIERTLNHVLYWDRDLWLSALSYKQIDRGNVPISKFKIKDNFSEIYIGHTTTTNWGSDKPMNAANIWNLDTGAGFSGKLTIMNIDTKEYFQSDSVLELYPNQKGRN